MGTYGFIILFALAVAILITEMTNNKTAKRAINVAVVLFLIWTVCATLNMMFGMFKDIVIFSGV